MTVSQPNLPTTRANRIVALGIAVLVGLAGNALLAPNANSAPRQIVITPDSDLRFGRFLVFGSGARVVSASGATTNYSVFPVPGDLTGPARFTVTYDRGNNSRKARDIEIDIVISNPTPATVGGVSGRVSALQTDLPGVGAILPGQPFRISMPNCQTRTCSRSFQVGGRIDVTRSAGGASLTIPLPIDGILVSDR